MDNRFDGADDIFSPRTSCPTSARTALILSVVLAEQIVLILALLGFGYELTAAFTFAAVLLIVDLLALSTNAEGLRCLMRRLGGGGAGSMLQGWS